jgi:putative flippase GtrA
VYLFSLLNSKKIRSRKTFSLLIWAFLISLAVYYIMPSVSTEIGWITAIPVSYFLTHYFVFIRKKLVPEIFLSVLFLLIIVIQISYFK